MDLLEESLLIAKHWAERQKTILPMAPTSPATLEVHEAEPCQTSPAVARGWRVLDAQCGGSKRQEARAQTVVAFPHNAWPILPDIRRYNSGGRSIVSHKLQDNSQGVYTLYALHGFQDHFDSRITLLKTRDIHIKYSTPTSAFGFPPTIPCIPPGRATEQNRICWQISWSPSLKKAVVCNTKA